jgi:hypothetical protein
MPTRASNPAVPGDRRQLKPPAVLAGKRLPKGIRLSALNAKVVAARPALATPRPDALGPPPPTVAPTSRSRTGRIKPGDRRGAKSRLRADRRVALRALIQSMVGNRTCLKGSIPMRSSGTKCSAGPRTSTSAVASRRVPRNRRSVGRARCCRHSFCPLLSGETVLLQEPRDGDTSTARECGRR